VAGVGLVECSEFMTITYENNYSHYAEQGLPYAKEILNDL
jgi:hypothetical protein